MCMHASTPQVPCEVTSIGTLYISKIIITVQQISTTVEPHGSITPDGSTTLTAAGNNITPTATTSDQLLINPVSCKQTINCLRHYHSDSHDLTKSITRASKYTDFYG